MTRPELVLLDLSGVVYQDGALLPGVPKALRLLRDAALPLRFLTNTTRRPPGAVLEQLLGMGVQVASAELFSAPQAARRYLERHDLHPFLLVHPGLAPEFADLTPGTDAECDAVLVGDAGEAFSYQSLNRAFRVLLRPTPLLAMARNRYFRARDRLCLDAGPFVCALEQASGVRAEVLGKPSSEFFHAACAAAGCEPARAVMVGDDVESDVLGALEAGLQAVLVRTGKYRPGDETVLAAWHGAVQAADLAGAAELILGWRSVVSGA